MRFQSVAAVSALGASLVAAVPSAIEARHATLSGDCKSRLAALGMGTMGVNAIGPGSSSAWIGPKGPYTVKFENTTPDDVCLVVWDDSAGYTSSFVGTAPPLITVTVPANKAHHINVSFRSGTSGAWAAVYPDTQMSSFGQIANTWGEYTMSPTGVVDVSREVTMSGHDMSITTKTCKADMNTCVYKCNTGSDTCGEAGTYTLENCSPGSQEGAQSDDAAMNGGCGWNGASHAHFSTVFS